MLFLDSIRLWRPNTVAANPGEDVKIVENPDFGHLQKKITFGPLKKKHAYMVDRPPILFYFRHYIFQMFQTIFSISTC